MSHSIACSTRGTSIIVITPTTKAISHNLLGAISAMGVVNVKTRVPQIKVAKDCKRKIIEKKNLI
jgi:hypothetical protein